jgi:hypothetical protein
MWSNELVADEDPNDVSPWLRDDWISDSTVPDRMVASTSARGTAGGEQPGGSDPYAEPSPDDFDDRHAGVSSRSSRSLLGRRIVAGAIIAALLIGSAAALFDTTGDSRGDPSGDTDGAPITTTEPEQPVTPATITPATIAPATIAPVTSTPVTSTPDSTTDSTTDTADRADTADTADPIPSAVVGEVPVWAQRVIGVPANLASMASTELITLTQSGIVHVTEFPSGSTRSLDVSDMGAQAQLVVGDRTILVFNSNELLVIRDEEPVVASSLDDGIIFVQPWTGTGSFVVTAPAIGPDRSERDWVLRADGTLESLDNRAIADAPFFSRLFSPQGDALVTTSGGVYAIDPSGATRRISPGSLIAIGQRHWAVEECDEALRCEYSIIEWDTGVATTGVLDRIDRFGFIDPATHMSPDGRSIIFRGDRDGSGRREILDVASGTTIEAGRMNELVYADSWAADSSGVFVTDRSVQFIDRDTGVVTEIDGLDRPRTVATTAAFSRP